MGWVAHVGDEKIDFGLCHHFSGGLTKKSEMDDRAADSQVYATSTTAKDTV